MSSAVSAPRSRGAFVRRLWPSASLFLALACSVVAPPCAKGSFIGYYQLSAFSLSNLPDGDGFAVTPDGGLTVILTGSNFGTDLPSTTNLTISAAAAGLVQFNYQYASLDEAGWDYAGYLLGTTFYPLADLDGQSGSVSFLVPLGGNFGFRVGTLDNQGEPGILTVQDFVAPGDQVPEPGSFSMLLLAAGVMLVCLCWKRWRQLVPAADRLRR
jgi:hypothetical protein